MWRGDTAPQSIILIAIVIIMNFLHFYFDVSIRYAAGHGYSIPLSVQCEH